MSTPDETARLAAEAQVAARDAAARVILHAEAWSSAAAAVRAVRALELAVHTESSATSAAPGRRASRGKRSASCSASGRSRPRGRARSPSSRTTIPLACRPSTHSRPAGVPVGLPGLRRPDRRPRPRQRASSGSGRPRRRLRALGLRRRRLGSGDSVMDRTQRLC